MNSIVEFYYIVQIYNLFTLSPIGGQTVANFLITVKNILEYVSAQIQMQGFL